MRAADLKAGMEILCPITKTQERVTMVQPHVGPRVFIRTSRHDHVRGNEEEIEVLTCSHSWRWSDSRNGFVCLGCWEFDSAD